MSADLFRDALVESAKNARLELVSCHKQSLALVVTSLSKEDQAHRIHFENLVFLDMPPEFVLKKLEFGGVDLLPKNYLREKLKGYEGDDDLYRVLKMTDDEKNEYFILAYGEEEVTED